MPHKKEDVEAFLRSNRSKLPIDVAMNHIERLEGDGWTIEANSHQMVFTTPPITFGKNGVSATSRFQLSLAGLRSYPRVIALDAKPHWPSPHPHYGCWGEGENVFYGSLDPFAIVETAVAVFHGEQNYSCAWWGEAPPKVCRYCEHPVEQNHKVVEYEGMWLHENKCLRYWKREAGR